MTKLKIGITGLFFVLMASACSLSLASDITPPPSMQTPNQEAQTTATSSAPILPPDVTNGKMIYEQKCIDCHGPKGMGDGTQAAQLPGPVAPIGDYQFAKSKSPLQWFNIISNGNIENFMPGFQSLNDRERWDVTAYVLSLSMNYDYDETLNTFKANCATCHEPGNNAGFDDYLDASTLANTTQEQIVEFIRQGHQPEMPAFGDQFDDQTISALAAYVRALGFRNFVSEANTNAQQTPVNELTPTPTSSNGESVEVGIPFTITGSVTNLVEIPSDLIVKLTAFDSMSVAFEEEMPVDENGTYRFDNLEAVEGRVYQLSTTIEGIQYTSEVLHAPQVDKNGEVSLSLPINTTSSDASALFVERLHVFFDFIVENKVQVVELFVITNPTDQTIVPEDSATPIIFYPLPEGATNLQFQQGSIGTRYVKTADGFGDLQPISANSSSQILFAYDMDYPNKLSLSLKMPMPVQAAVFMLPAGSLTIKSDQLVSDGNRNVQGMNIQTYSAADLPANAQLDLQISGKIKVSPAATDNSALSLVIGGSVLLIAIVVAIFWFSSSLKKKKMLSLVEGEADQDTLLDAIIALDDSYKNGGITESAYHSRRDELLAQIKKIRKED